jgi:hypothetical protein
MLMRKRGRNVVIIHLYGDHQYYYFYSCFYYKLQGKIDEENGRI